MWPPLSFSVCESTLMVFKTTKYTDNKKQN